MTPLIIGTCGVVALWVLLACLIPLLRFGHRAPAIWAMAILGVPVLGWLTLHWGPGIGVAFFALGLALLLRQPRRPRRP
ncbi:DUF2484 family protein [Paracoccus sp. (in: a-proteobacteria)]|uniref:DUF2484 family protein n=1 Tax=Paracoccus sp. TaxID=267 RepID=UPI003A8921A2